MTIRVLTVDDDPDVRLTLPSALAGQPPGFDVRAVDGVLAAWSEIRRWSPDVVLLDARMPLAPGDTPSSRPTAGLRFLVEAQARAVAFKIVMHSASDEWRDACMRRGAAAYVVKPVLPSMLARVIVEVIGR